MMLLKHQFIPSSIKQYPVISSGSVCPFYELFEFFNRGFASFRNQEFFFVHFQNKTFRFLVECKNASNQDRANHHNFLHFLFLLLGFVLFLNVDTFSACSPADCNLYESSYYQGCSPTSGNNQYQCGGGSGSCSDVCGGCGWRIRTTGYLQEHQILLDSLCWVKITSAGLSCSRYGSKCTGLRPLRGTFIGLCGVGYESDFDVEIICACNDRSSSSSSPSSSSSALSSSSSFRYRDCISSPASRELCYYAGPDNESCGNQQANSWSPSCQKNGYACSARGLTQSDCWLGRVHVFAATWDYYENVGCTNIGCPSSSAPSSAAPSSAVPSSDSGSSSDSGGGGGGGSDGGESSSGSGGGESGSGGDGGVIPCGWGDYPPCIVDPIDPPFCQQYPELCYAIGGLDDSISRYGSAITDSLGRLIGILDSLDLGGGGSCLDSADCPPGDFSGDSVPFVPGDSSESGSGGSGSGGVYSWLRSVLSAASIPAASRTCPAFPSVEIELGGESQVIDFDICKQEFHLGGYHPVELFGLLLRAVSCLIAVYIALGAVTSLNAGFHKMKRLGG